MKIVDGHLAKYTRSVIGGSAIAILIPRISAWIILNRVGFFLVLIGCIFDDACTSSFGSDSDKGVISCNFLGRPGLRFCISLDGCVFGEFGCSSRILSLVVLYDLLVGGLLDKISSWLQCG